jgi:RimJ/RimL family protein N-acetyltransferase
MTAVVLRDGSTVRVRPVETADAAELQRAFALLSERSRYLRFMTGTTRLSDAVARTLTDVDHHDHEALVALDTEPGASRTGDIVGVARYVFAAGVRDEADLAITVGDEWQGRGLGGALLALLGERARAEGVDRFSVDVLVDNPAMLALVRATGGVVVPDTRGSVASGHIDLTSPGRSPQRTGYPPAMTDSSDLRHDDEANQAVQAVVDRVLSYQAGAPVETVAEELRSGLREIDADMPDEWVARTAGSISQTDPA